MFCFSLINQIFDVLIVFNLIKVILVNDPDRHSNKG